MSLSPDDFHDLLERSFADAPVVTAPGRDLAAGRRRLLRRRTTVVASGAAAAVVVAVAALGLGTRVDRSVEPAPPPAPVTPSAPAEGTDVAVPADVLAQCRANGADPRTSTDPFFASGTPRGRGLVTTDASTVVALESADGTQWAECEIPLVDSQDGAVLTAHDNRPDDPGTSTSSFSAGVACPDDVAARSCPRYTVSLVDRLPSPVAAVRFDFGDGDSQTIEVNGGYVVLDRVGTVPDGHPYDTGFSGFVGFDPLEQVTYLDADGAVLASGDPNHAPSPGVTDPPPLSAYPSWRSGDPLGATDAG